MTDEDAEEARRQWRERHPEDPGTFRPPPFVAVAVADLPATRFGEVGPATAATVDVTFTSMPACYLEGVDIWDTRVSPPEFVTWMAAGRRVAEGETVTLVCGPEVTGPVIRRAMDTGFPW